MSSVGSEHDLGDLVSASDPVLQWYSGVYSRRIDVIGDYCGHEYFLIEGDALLLHCFSDEHIDFNPGFQLVHAAWAVENFLRGLVTRRCNFHIAFIDEHRELCVPHFASDDSRERYLLARAAIIRHLRANLRRVHPEIEVNVFTSVTSDSFAEYLANTDLYFVLIHDGAEPRASRKRGIMNKTLDSLNHEDHEGDEEELRAKIAFRQLIYWFTEKGISSVLINGLEWRDTKVVTTVLENPRMSNEKIGMTFNDYSEAIAEPRPKYLDRSIFDTVKTDRYEPTEREYVTLLVLYALLAGEKATKEFSDAFLRHTALVSRLPLSERLVEAATLGEEATASLELFCDEACSILTSETWHSNMSTLPCSCDVVDLVDGRILAACLKDDSLGRNDAYQSLAQALKAIGPVRLMGEEKAVSTDQGANGKTDDNTNSAADSYTVLPFSNEVFDAHLTPVQLKVDKAGDVIDATTSQIFREVSHWHNAKRPMDPKIREDQIAKSAKQQFFARRRNQWFMAEMTSYAASLTNSVGKVLKPEIITSGSSEIEKKDENAKPKVNPKAGKKGAPSKKEAMLAKIAADRSKKEEANSETLVQGWRLTCHTLDKEPTPVARYQKAVQHLTTLNSELKRNALEAEVRLYLLNALLAVWTSACRSGEKVKHLHIAALIYDNLSTFSTLRRPLTKTIVGCLEKTYKEMKLPKLPIPTPEGDRPLAFKFILAEVTGLALAIPIPISDFQLLHCGPYFDRSIDSAPDPRVPFEPDAWQRRVLDGIDAKRSQLVIAPTSAGKTFISFYAMKQVLESNDDDILVYVAPTKALVNQIAAEVQGRFSKKYSYAGNSVWGIHTRDYRINNPTGCQILVTVPHILQIMLLAPSNANTWAKRVKWIIFDEVHCIGQAEDGLIWEQLLLMAPCPIIALSATIGNPDEFNTWLSSTQKAVGNDFDMIQHKHRYSDLRKFVYIPEKSQDRAVKRFQGLPENRAFAQLGLDNCDAFSFLHPVASLVNRSRGIPSDLSLEARDCFTLWQTMSKHQTKDYPISKDLDPGTALPTVVKKVHIIAWEKAIKDVLQKWMADADSPYSAVLKDVSSNLMKKPSDRKLDNEDEPLSDDDADEEELEEIRDSDARSILPLLSKLHEQDALPGIIFNYDRGLCERICKTLMHQLETAETKWKESSPKWKSDLAKWEEYKKMMTKANKRHPPKLSKKKGADGEEGLTKDDLLRDAAGNEASPWASFDPNTPVDRFHFADNRKMAKEELAKHEKELIRREVPEWLLAALRRGIGVHHAGLNRKYRQVCEMLFRKGYLRVVIATGTLALGINMPCKTVVFSGDSVFLTALNYRQAAGRAGRRGFDMLGNVVFHGISMSKIHRLISSRLPDINGHFPITTTLVLRLFTLLDESKKSAFAVRSINALLSQPRLYLGGEESKMTVLHHLRFSIEYLRRQYLLDSHGKPLNLAGAVSHLYFTENSSFAFHALLKDGYFHKTCSKIETNPEAVLLELMLTMSHLFGRQYCRQADEEFVEQVIKRSPSIVFLPPMPKEAAQVLRKHNQTTLEIYQAYVRTFVEQHLPERDEALPLTKIKTGGTSSSSSIAKVQRRAPTVVRSPFVALSGHDDKFDSVHDLCSTTRSGVFLEEAVIPYVGLYPEESELPLNAYLYDYFNHGDVKALATANRIRRGDVWFVLNDFSMVLATIVTSLANFLNLTTASDLDFTDVRGEGEEAEEAQEDNLIPDADSGYETASTTSGPIRPGAQANNLPIQTKKKKKVADSWDDDAEEEELELEIAAQKAKRDAEIKEMREKPAWEEGTGLMNVYKAFKALKEEFDTKFRAMWA